MLEHLFGSRTRVELLQLFLNNPTKVYYLRELSRLLRIQLNAVRREVETLLSFEILTETSLPQSAKPAATTSKGGKPPKYLKANTDFVLYPELKAILLKAQLLVERSFVDAVQKICKPQLFLLTGFFVGVEGSPTDVLLVGKVNRDQLQKIVRDVERRLNHEINYTVMSPTEYKYRHDITDRFLYDILEGQKIVMVDAQQSGA